MRPAAWDDTTDLDLESTLGDPFFEGAAISFEEVVAHDEREAFFTRFHELNREWGALAYLVPADLGGRLRSFEEPLAIVRSISRRDPVVALALGSTLIGSLPVWLFGTDEQRRFVADRVLAGQFGALGVTEPDHGSDLLASETTATPRSDGSWILDGTKWLIGNATRSSFATVLARSGPEELSMFLVDRSRLPEGACSTLPKIRTHGLRGHDLAGFTFRDCPVDASALLGKRGRGFEQLAKALQYSRTLITGAALGVADTALRLAATWSLERKLYGAPIVELAPIRESVLRSAIDLAICECVTVPTARALSVSNEQIGLWSSVTKYLVPVTVENIVREAALVLGAQHYLRERPAGGIFQKLARDQGIFSVFEGTTHVNLRLIAGQLPMIMRRNPGTNPATLDHIFELNAPAPPWRPEPHGKIALGNGGRGDIVGSLPAAVLRVDGLVPFIARPEVAARIRDLAVMIEHQREKLAADVRRLAEAPGSIHASPRSFDVARRHCHIHAAAACLQIWLHNREALGGAFADGDWLVLCLERIGSHLSPDVELSPDILDRFGARFFDSLRVRGWFSVLSGWGESPSAVRPTALRAAPDA